MSTCNFFTRNAFSYYAMNEFNEWTEEDVQMAAKARQDGDRFSEMNDWEDRGMWRDRGRIVLEYRIDPADLLGGSWLGLIGRIIVRPGYYAGAVLDWELTAELHDGDRGYLGEWAADWDDMDQIADDMADEWAYYQDKAGEETRGSLSKYARQAMEEAGRALDQICRELCDQPLGCDGVASNGEAFYYALS